MSPRPLTVGYVLDRYAETSQTFVTGEIAELRRQGARVHIEALRRGDLAVDDPDAHWLREDRPPRWRRRASHLRWRVLHPARYRTFRSRVAEVSTEVGSAPSQFEWWDLLVSADRLRRARVDWLHAHFAWGGAAAAYCLSALCAVPWSITLHANDMFSRRRNLDLKLAAANQLVTVCQYNLDWLRSELGLARPVRMVVCGVSVPPDAPRQPDVDVVAVGRLVPKKGFDVLVRATAELKARGRRVSVEVIGDGAERDALAALVDELDVGEQVRLVGRAPHRETLDRIGSARVFTLPARVADDGDRDSMPVVIKEAMARAVPVVATDVVAIPEMVDDSVGRLVPPDDPVALADALSELLDDDAAAEALGRAGRARVEERFTIHAEVAKLRQMFAETS